MKCEQPAGCAIRDPIRVFEPGMLPESLQKKIEEFRFPLSEYPSPAEREMELEYDRMYLKRSVYVIYYSPFDFTSFIAVARIIEKRNPEEKLPIEFATVVSTTVDSMTSPKRDINGGLFPVDYYDSRFPVCEIGGLRAAEIDPAKGVTAKIRYNALKEILINCDKQIHKRNYKCYFLTCTGTPHMERLYEKWRFHEVATITYDKEKTWKALWRDPAKDPEKNVAEKKLSALNPVEKVGYYNVTIKTELDFRLKTRGISTCASYPDEAKTVHQRELELVC